MKDKMTCSGHDEETGEVCELHGSYGFGLRGFHRNGMVRYFCVTHRKQGERYFKEINKHV